MKKEIGEFTFAILFILKNTLMKFIENITALFLLFTNIVIGQNNLEIEKNTPDYKHSIGASFFMLGNLTSDSPDYYLITYGRQLTKKDRIFAEFNTWKYQEPLGTYGNSEELYPGFVRAFGVGVGYQRFHWKGLFNTIQATPFLKQYHNAANDKTQKGFQLYLQLQTGYRVEFLNKRFYIEPAIALKYWPVDTNFPADFAIIEEGAPKHIWEPSLNFGFKF